MPGRSDEDRMKTFPSILFRRLQALYATVNDQCATLYRLCVRSSGAPIALQNHTVSLPGDRVMALTRASGIRRLEVRAGSVWLTATPAGGDVLLKAGDVFYLKDQWPFILQSMTCAEIRLSD